MAARPLPPIHFLEQILICEPETGTLIWKVRPASMFDGMKYPAERLAKSWNTRCAGKPAFCTPSGGYLIGGINDVSFMAHRVIWKMTYGTEPEEIDHINHVRTDNRIANLRAATAKINRKNMSRRSGKSGLTGVYRHSQNDNWVAQINIDGKRVHLGCFDSAEEALAARIRAAASLGYHVNHGRPAI